ncbi:sensor histidine kinase [sulfur-oxidizing endosymbiont of Gigantopelta aegis]|uniref:sensor histidine kinase n=1 Tax=sulfur-oxidizing endosymbiont of Gigantopelta aegis TaxID=2794934 RepID=UPI0018DE1C05|nr:HAMP domain-containing sensor histidine kinase [sulfur-oxidizing endosymbiont of Gigantopelta aegis]
MHTGFVVDHYKDSVFYRTDKETMHRLPSYLQSLSVGKHEVLHNDKAFHILVKQDGQFRYFFEVNESDFEQMEQMIIAIIVIAMFLSWTVASFSSRFLSRKILDPIQVLSDKIRLMDQNMSNIHLIDEFADDEVGQLARFFDDYNHKINTYLTREKLFTSDVSHELRTPLMVISSSCELLLAQSEIETHSESKQQAQLLKIQSACQEMKSLVTIFLALARNDEVNPNLTSLSEVLSQQYEKYLPIAEAKGLKLICLPDNDASHTEKRYSEEFLTIIIGNLLGNAIKYTLQGEIVISFNEQGFSIRDTGPGIPDEIADSVFDPFIQYKTNQNDGIGLGLSIVKRICEKKGWEAHIESDKDKGTIVSIVF